MNVLNIVDYCEERLAFLERQMDNVIAKSKGISDTESLAAFQRETSELVGRLTSYKEILQHIVSETRMTVEKGPCSPKFPNAQLEGGRDGIPLANQKAITRKRWLRDHQFEVTLGGALFLFVAASIALAFV